MIASVMRNKYPHESKDTVEPSLIDIQQQIAQLSEQLSQLQAQSERQNYK